MQFNYRTWICLYRVSFCYSLCIVSLLFMIWCKSFACDVFVLMAVIITMQYRLLWCGISINFSRILPIKLCPFYRNKSILYTTRSSSYSVNILMKHASLSENVYNIYNGASAQGYASKFTNFHIIYMCKYILQVYSLTCYQIHVVFNNNKP